MSKLPLVFALDMPWEEGKVWIDRLRDRLWGFKVGSILFTRQGPEVVSYIKDKGSNVFLDLKFHDIPNTVYGAVESAFERGVDWLTVHASNGEACLSKIAPLQTDVRWILAVTVLTSMDQQQLQKLKVDKDPKQLVMERAKLAVDSGIRSLVCSVQEAAQIRKVFGNINIITPGIRLAQAHDDQKRIGSIKDAFSAGANAAVLGRALSQAKDWQKAWEQIDQETPVDSPL